MKKEVFVVLLFLAMLLSGCTEPIADDAQEVKEGAEQEQPVKEEIAGPDESIIEEDQAIEEVAEKSESPGERDAPRWGYGSSAIEGNYADSDFVDLGNGKYRMYYAIEPEVPG